MVILLVLLPALKRPAQVVMICRLLFKSDIKGMDSKTCHLVGFNLVKVCIELYHLY